MILGDRLGRNEPLQNGLTVPLVTHSEMWRNAGRVRKDRKRTNTPGSRSEEVVRIPRWEAHVKSNGKSGLFIIGLPRNDLIAESHIPDAHCRFVTAKYGVGGTDISLSRNGRTWIKIMIHRRRFEIVNCRIRIH